MNILIALLIIFGVIMLSIIWGLIFLHLHLNRLLNLAKQEEPEQGEETP
jgi:uncharacterized membrane protein YciS (DUF1049 family)